MVDISKSFHGIYANRDINFSINSGEILGLLGENGAGKTTLMNILYGLYQPNSGQIKINDEAVRISNPVESIQHGIGMVHQHFMLVQNHSVIENIALGFKDTPFFFPKKKIKKSVEEFAKNFGFKIETSKKVWQLSAGEQQRVEIVKALLNGADLLILDEATSNVDTVTEEKIQAAMKNALDNRTSFVIAHRLKTILDADIIVVLKDGEIIEQGSHSELLAEEGFYAELYHNQFVVEE